MYRLMSLMFDSPKLNSNSLNGTNVLRRALGTAGDRESEAVRVRKGPVPNYQGRNAHQGLASRSELAKRMKHGRTCWALGGLRRHEVGSPCEVV